MAGLELAIRLVTQAINQDTAKNYEEAARCYRDAIISFRLVAQNKSLSAGVQAAILAKCCQYEERLRKLDKFLFSRADLSKLFRDCVQFHEEHEEPSLENEETLLNKGHELIEKAKRQDAKENYADSIKLYEDGVKWLLNVSQFSKYRNTKQAEAINFMCLLIHERIETIRNHLEKGLPINQNRVFDSCNSSQEPLVEEQSDEERALLMEEVRSNMSLTPSLCGSRHSLYPTCEIRRADVNFAIPLADLNHELQLSTQSLQSFHSSLGDLRISLDESHDCMQNNLDSDSGIFDRSKGSSATRSPTHSPTSAEEDKLSLGMTESNLIPTLPASPFKSLKKKRKQFLPDPEDDDLRVVSSEEIINGKIIVTRQHHSSSSSSAKMMMEEAYLPTAMVKARPEYVPPRSFCFQKNSSSCGGEDNEEDNFDKGCYYFLSCLDSLWIL